MAKDIPSDVISHQITILSTFRRQRQAPSAVLRHSSSMAPMAILHTNEVLFAMTGLIARHKKTGRNLLLPVERL